MVYLVVMLKTVLMVLSALGFKAIYKETNYFESDYDAVANEVVNNENGSIQIRGIYKNEKSHLEHIYLLNADDDELNGNH